MEAWQRRLVRERAGADERAELLEAVERLPAEQRELVVLRVWGGLSFVEIAEAVEVATSTAYRKYHEAIDSLRQQWNEPCPSKTPK
jgi:RNA polymerase sigma-70 factor (ECF subfamily)